MHIAVVINTVLVNKCISYYKNDICTYKMLHVLTTKGHHQAPVQVKTCDVAQRQILFL